MARSIELANRMRMPRYLLAVQRTKTKEVAFKEIEIYPFAFCFFCTLPYDKQDCKLHFTGQWITKIVSTDDLGRSSNSNSKRKSILMKIIREIIYLMRFVLCFFEFKTHGAAHGAHTFEREPRMIDKKIEIDRKMSEMWTDNLIRFWCNYYFLIWTSTTSSTPSKRRLNQVKAIILKRIIPIRCIFQFNFIQFLARYSRAFYQLLPICSIARARRVAISPACFVSIFALQHERMKHFYRKYVQSPVVDFSRDFSTLFYFFHI